MIHSGQKYVQKRDKGTKGKELIRISMSESKMRREHRSRCIVVVLSSLLLLLWGMVFVVKGSAGVISWWLLQLFSLFGVIGLLYSLGQCVWNVCCRRQKMGIWFYLKLLILVGLAYPACWFVGIAQFPYPVDINTMTPAATVRWPFNEPALVGWGGNTIANNYHVIAPNERFAYDLLVSPVSVGSDLLEDYGSYGAEVVAPASGTVVEVLDTEQDHGINEENQGSMIGNHIYLKLEDTGTFLVLAHLRQDSARVKQGDHVEEGTILAEVGNSGNSSEPHLHIHHQRQDPSTTNMFIAEGLPLYFRDIDGPAMPEGGMHEQDGKSIPQGQVIAPIHKSK